MTRRIVIVGAGMAGIACARRLADAGLSPIVLDKGRGIGGRLATRRAEGGQFDHGAQYVTTGGVGFAAVLDDLRARGVVAEWDDGSGRAHLVGLPGMSGLARALAAGLDIRQQAQVTGLRQTAEGWTVQMGDKVLVADLVVITAPAPQVATLLGPDHAFAGLLKDVAIAPCLTLMALLTGAPRPFVTRKDADDPLTWIADDSTKPGRPQGASRAWVAQAGAAFSAEHLEQDRDAIAALMLPLLCDRLGASPSQVTHAVAHRWRYARVTLPLGQPFLRSGDGTLYAGGDWCLGARVEAAWTSGDATAADILAQRG